jgi:hypothetical protein
MENTELLIGVKTPVMAKQPRHCQKFDQSGVINIFSYEKK